MPSRLWCHKIGQTPCVGIVLPLQEKKWSQSGILPRKCPAEPGEGTRAHCVHNFLEELPNTTTLQPNASTTALAPGSNHAATAHAASRTLRSSFIN